MKRPHDEAIRFALEFPDTAWCYGNHDLSYFWHCLESGYSSMASATVQRKLLELRRTVPEDHPIQFVQKIDNVLFSHGGVLNYFVEEYVPKSKYHDVDAVVEEINKLGRIEMWNDMSPIWLRPQRPGIRLYKPRKLLQVVGHTPMNEITREKSDQYRCIFHLPGRADRSEHRSFIAGYRDLGSMWGKIEIWNELTDK